MIRPGAIQYQGFVEPLTAPPVALSWQPEFQDALTTGYRPTLHASLVTAVVVPLALAAVPISWAPKAPDNPVVRTTTLQNEGPKGPFVAALAPTTPTFWAPEYPDNPPPATGRLDSSLTTPVFTTLLPIAWATGSTVPYAGRLTQYQRGAAPVTTSQTVPALSATEYPDYLQQPTRLLSTTDAQPSLFEATRTRPVVSGQVTGTIMPSPIVIQYQDFAAPATTGGVTVTFAGSIQAAQVMAGPLIQYQGSAAPTPFTPPPPLTWQPEFPDTLGLIPAMQARMQAWADWTFQVQQTTPPLTWRGSYPDQAPGRAPTTPQFEVSILDRLTVPTDWDTTYPDFLLRARTTAAEGQSVAVLDRLTAPNDWDTTYADWLPVPPRPPEFPAFTTGVTSSVVPTPRPLVWLGRYADFAKAAQPLADWQTLALGPFPISVPTDQLGWRGRYPDWLPLLRPVEFQAFTTGLTASSIPLPRPLVWLGQYPDRARGPQPLTDWVTEAFYPFPIPTPTNQLGWRGVYADWIARLVPAEYPAFTTGLTASTIPLPRPLVWQGRYADTAPGAARVADFQAFAFYPFPISVPTNQLAWRGVYPDWLQHLFPAEYPAFTTGLTASTIPLPRPLVWLGTWPDFARMAQGVLAPPTFAFDAFPRPSTPLLSWQPEFMDWLVQQRATQIESPALAWSPQTTVPLLASWHPQLPDLVLAVRRAPESRIDVPLVTVAISQFAWRPVYPDRLVRLQAVIEAVQNTPLGTLFDVRTFGWRGSYPDRAPGRMLDAANQEAFATGVTPSGFPLPKPLVWQGRWADFARGPQPTPVGAWPFTAGVRPLFIPGPEILRYLLNVYAMAGFTLELVRQPSMTNDTAKQPRMVEEDSEE